MKVLPVLFLTFLVSSNAFADKCIYQASDLASTLMEKNRESFKTVEVDSSESTYDGANTDSLTYRITGRDASGKVSTLTYELTLSNDGCVLTDFRLLGGN